MRTTVFVSSPHRLLFVISMAADIDYYMFRYLRTVALVKAKHIYRAEHIDQPSTKLCTFPFGDRGKWPENVAFWSSYYTEAIFDGNLICHSLGFPRSSSHQQCLLNVDLTAFYIRKAPLLKVNPGGTNPIFILARLQRHAHASTKRF